MTINKLLAIAAATAFLSTTAVAAEGDFMKADQDTDGALSYQEVMAVMPGMTADQFKAADADGNGVLSKEEFASVTG